MAREARAGAAEHQMQTDGHSLPEWSASSCIREIKRLASLHEINIPTAFWIPIVHALRAMLANQCSSRHAS